jgi:hypothetical protein
MNRKSSVEHFKRRTLSQCDLKSVASVEEQLKPLQQLTASQLIQVQRNSIFMLTLEL